MIKDLLSFYKKSPIYFASAIIYYILASIILGGNFILAFILYACSMAVVFSSIGEKILKFLERVRSLETKQEREFLTPIFEEVYEQAKIHTPQLGEIEICVVDKMSVNACALGKHTIAVTKGAMETFSENELKALLAHEIAHIVHSDTTASLYALVGNGLFTILVLINRLILNALDLADMAFSKHGTSFFGIIVKLSRWIFDIVILLLMLIMNLAIAINSRKNELRADRYAFELGYGQEMVDALYLLEKISLGDNSDTISRLTASHPRVSLRIQNIKTLLEQE